MSTSNSQIVLEGRSAACLECLEASAKMELSMLSGTGWRGGIQYQGGPLKARDPPLFQTQMANTVRSMRTPPGAWRSLAIPCSILFLYLHLPQPPLLSHPLRRDHQDETSGARRCRVPQPGPARQVERFSCGSRAKTAKRRKGGNKARC